MTNHSHKQHHGEKNNNETVQQEEDIVRVSCIKHVFEDKTMVHLCGIDFHIRRGERIVVMGPSGSGKTTLLKHLLGLLEPHEGHVSVFGVSPSKEYRKIRERIGFVSQSVEEQIIAPTVFEDVRFSPINYGYSEEDASELAIRAMERLGIMHLKDRAPHYLSGGEKRKVALAGAIVLKPELLVLDEPFLGLDLLSQSEFISIINALNKDFGTAVILTTHDVNLMPEVADFVYLLKAGGEISKRGTPEEIFANLDELGKYKIEPPVLSRIFLHLKKRFPKIKIPLTADKAEKYLDELLK